MKDADLSSTHGPPSEMAVGRSLFWRVAALLVVLQLVLAVFAAGFAIWSARGAQETLAAAALAARLDATAEEIERRAESVGSDLSGFPDALLVDLGYRFPDALIIVDLNGDISRPIWPAKDAFVDESAGANGRGLTALDSMFSIPEFVNSEEAFDDVVVDFSDEAVQGGFASAPLYDAVGFPTGLLLVQPLTRSLDLELMESRSAFRRSIRIIAIVSIMMALLLGVLLTLWLVRPLRKMANIVHQIGSPIIQQASGSGAGAANNSLRIPVKGSDEIAVLGHTINNMADRVEASLETLRESDLMRRELVANVGHDLRTPLAAMKAHLEEAVRYQGEGRMDQVHSSLESAERQVEYVTRLVNDLFELSRLEGASPHVHLEQVLLPELFSDVLDMHRSDAERRQVILSGDFEQELPVIQADGVRLIRLISNLLSNALRHTPTGGSVTLSAGVEASDIVITVTDTGEGIDPEIKSMLFERYYRGDDARTRKGEGHRTGLGLAISKAIAEAHGGLLTVSDAVGGGTRMIVSFPIDLDGRIS